MSSLTIDYGIDLGTTNSVVARMIRMEPEVIKNNEGHEFTPSVIWIDRRNRLYVGRIAKERQKNDPDNVAYEFKRRMGEDWQFRFECNSRQMGPEELSAEVLKSLKQSVERRKGEELRGAVITVPAAFELPQCEATKAAAIQAGFAFYPQLQEPVAAALAYGFQAESEKVYWLVFDLGGGTFDAAVINMRDGMFHVVNHLGDNDLGGQLIDWAIVDKLLIPAAQKEYKRADFRRGDPKWRSAIIQLKMAAEEAKIRLSNETSIDIEIDPLWKDEHGEPIAFFYELERSDVERLAEPIVHRAIHKSRQALSEKRLGAGDVEKVLLVGGPTLMPYLRDRLRDPREGLGIPLAFDRDPLTVVAQGAAIFAGGQRVEIGPPPPPARGFALKLEYQPLGSDPEPPVGGRLIASEGEDFTGFTIEFVNRSAQPPWRGGKVEIAPNGAFLTYLWAEKGLENVFQIELFDGQGNSRDVEPNSLSYRIGISPSEPPLTHSVGVALASNEVAWIARKGDPLPVHKRVTLRSVEAVRRGHDRDILRIPVIEGESERADRNSTIGRLEIRAAEITRDVPAGGDVEVTVEIDTSRIVRVKAFVPILEQDFCCKLDYQDYGKDTASVDQLRLGFETEKERLRELRARADETGDPMAQEALQQIDSGWMVQEVENALAASDGNEEAVGRCLSRLRELRAALDQTEEALRWPMLVAEAEEEIEEGRKILNEPAFQATAEEKATFQRIRREMIEAIETRSHTEVLHQLIREMQRIAGQILVRQPGWWAAQVDHLEQKRHTLSNPTAAASSFAKARKAIQTGDVAGLQAAVRQVWELLPQDDPDRQRISDVTL